MFYLFSKRGNCKSNRFITCPRSRLRTRTPCSSLKPGASQSCAPCPHLQDAPLTHTGLQERRPPSLFSLPQPRFLLAVGSSVPSPAPAVLPSPSCRPVCGWGEQLSSSFTRLGELSLCQQGESGSWTPFCVPFVICPIRSPKPILGTLTLPFATKKHNQRCGEQESKDYPGRK